MARTSSFFDRTARIAALGLLGTLGCNGDDTAMADDGTGTGTDGGTMTTIDSPTTGADTTASPDTGDTDDDGSTTSSVDDTGDSEDDANTTGDPPDPPMPPGRVITCGNKIAAAPDGQTCGVTPGNSTLLLQGTVLAGFDVYEAGTVLVDGSQENGRILCTGCDCADEAEAAGATVIACPDGVISPGLINPHDHITFTLSRPVPHGTERYDHRHDWRLGLGDSTELDTFPGSSSSREAVLYGEVRMLLGGATSLTGSVGGASAGGLVRNLDRAELTGGLSGVDVNYRTFPLGDTSGDMLTNSCGYPFIDGANNLTDDIYLPHIAEGITNAAQNEFACMSGAPGGEDLIAPNTSVIHGIGVEAEDVRTMGDIGAMLVWSPRSNVDLYGVTADIPMYRNLGVRIALGTDWSASGSMNVLRELACADSLNQDHFGGALADVELWMMSTHWAAASQGAADQLGLISEGHIADLAIFDGSKQSHHRAVIEADPSTVSLVLRGGQPLHGDAAIIEGLVPADQVDGCETLDVCGSDKRICAGRDAGLTLAAITGAVNEASYEFFFCGEPDAEPSCDPSRPDEFPLRGGPDDMDGDGVADGEDNCPEVFNPLRPMDDDVQADADQDGIGNSCDTCPLDATNSCEIPNVFDVDGDGVGDPDDNCPNDANDNQADTDDDGLGDACDSCPMTPNPGGGPCPASIYDIKDGTILDGEDVFVQSALVTGVGENGYFLQVPDDDPDYAGVDFSGIFVFSGGDVPPAVGDLIDLEGNVVDFFGQIQLQASNAPVVVASGHAPPTPEPATVADIIEGGTLQQELEGVVVEVTDLMVTDVMPMAGPGNGDPTNEFEVAGGLRVNDFFYLVDPFPMVGQTYPRVAGVARWANDFTKLEPRNLADYPATLISFGDPESFLLNGATAEPIPGLVAQLSTSVTVDTAITLDYADDAVVTGPASIDVPMGASSVVVELTGVAVGTADVTADLDGTSFTTAVRVYDDAEPRVPTLVPSTVNVALGAMATLTVELDLPAPLGAGQTVDLALAPDICASAPATVDVPAELLSAEFDVTGLACVGDEVLTASVGVASSDATISVVDSPVFDNVVIAEVYYDHSGGDDQFEWVKLYNGTGGPVDLSDFSLGWGGNDYTYGTLDLAGVVPDGSCFVVGGPMGDAVNGFPDGAMYDLVADFNPDMQNSNGAGVADGVALFNLEAGSIVGGSIPVDSVLWGVDNSNGLLDESGAAADVDVADAPSTVSVVLQSDGTWGFNAMPSPLNCTPFPSP